MPFDGTGFGGQGPRRGGRHERVVSTFIIALAVLLLAMPVSLAALIDITRTLLPR